MFCLRNLRLFFHVPRISQISDDSWVSIFINESLDLLILKFCGLFGILEEVNAVVDLNESDGMCLEINIPTGCEGSTCVVEFQVLWSTVLFYFQLSLP